MMDMINRDAVIFVVCLAVATALTLVGRITSWTGFRRRSPRACHAADR
jgi:hypothetical protein